METVNKMDKIFIYKDHKAIIICPECEKSKTLDVSEHVHTREAVKLKHPCECGYVYNVLLERRNRYRKIVDVPGTYAHFISGEQLSEGSMTVKEITRAGLGLKLDGNEIEKINIDDTLFVEFHLDDESRSLIRKEAIIRNIRGPYIGTEFSSVDLYDRALGVFMFK
jgi:hypothetical protein